MRACILAVLFQQLDTEKKEHSSPKSLKVVQKVKKNNISISVRQTEGETTKARKIFLTYITLRPLTFKIRT